jgi:hypothetical protein
MKQKWGADYTSAESVPLDVDVPIGVFETSIAAQNVYPLEYVLPDLAATVVGALLAAFGDDGFWFVVHGAHSVIAMTLGRDGDLSA